MIRPIIWALAITSYSFGVPERAGYSLGLGMARLNLPISMLEFLAGIMELCHYPVRVVFPQSPSAPRGVTKAAPGSEAKLIALTSQGLADARTAAIERRVDDKHDRHLRVGPGMFEDRPALR